MVTMFPTSEAQDVRSLHFGPISNSHRSVVEISELNADSNLARYFYIPQFMIISQFELLQCNKFIQEHFLVPDISDILPVFFDATQIQNVVYKVEFAHLTGPARLLASVNEIIKLHPKGLVFVRREVRRGIECAVYSVDLNQNEHSSQRFEAYVPLNLEQGVTATNWDSIVAFTLMSMPFEYTLKKQQDVEVPKRAVFSLDYFAYHSIDMRKSPEWKDSFTMPLVSGCSGSSMAAIDSVHLPTGPTFAMSYVQSSRASDASSLFVAFDSQKMLLRTQVESQSVTIQDFKQRVAYHIDERSPTPMNPSQHAKLKRCAAISLKASDDHFDGAANDKTSQIRQPAKSDDPLRTIGLFTVHNSDNSSNSLSVDQLLGNTFDWMRMGSGYLRGSRCDIYESTKKADKLPLLFGRRYEAREGAYEYVVQYRILRLDQDSEHLPDIMSDAGVWWPGRITLYERDVAIGTETRLLDNLEIYDFSWSLQGWSIGAGDMFTPSECHLIEDDRARVEFTVAPDDARSLDVKQLDRKRSLLEDAATEMLVSVFKLPRPQVAAMSVEVYPHYLQFTSYVLERPSHVMRVSFFGYGVLTAGDSSDAIRFDGLSEQDCVNRATLVEGATMVVYCDANSAQQSLSTCEMVKQSEPMILLDDNKERHPCRSYHYTEKYLQDPITDTIAWSTIATLEQNEHDLADHVFAVTEPISGQLSQSVTFLGKVQLYKVSRHTYLEMLPGLTIVPDATPMAHTLDGLHLSGQVDCAKACELDFQCHSYSYCWLDRDCVLSAMDMRQTVADQLLNQAPRALNDTSPIRVKDNYQIEYNLVRASDTKRCAIYEKDHLSAYTRTNELVAIDNELIKQSQPMSLQDCARHTTRIEHENLGQYHPTFAYCGHEQVCLTDYLNQVNQQSQESKAADVQCQLYQKRYLSYFKIAHQTHPQELMNNSQVRIFEDITNEECAHVCWQKLAYNCVSFDYCHVSTTMPTSQCLIQTLRDSSELANFAAYEQTRDKIAATLGDNCFHFDKDQKLGKLRQQLDENYAAFMAISSEARGCTSANQSRGAWFYLVMFILLICGFIAGDSLNPMIANTYQRASKHLTTFVNGHLSGLRTDTQSDVQLDVLNNHHYDRDTHS